MSARASSKPPLVRPHGRPGGGPPASDRGRWRRRCLGEGEGEHRSPVRGVDHRDRALVGAGGLVDDREAEARARLRARLGRAVEAGEHVGEVVLGDAGAVVADHHRRAVDGDLHRRGGLAELRRVVDEVADGPGEVTRLAHHRARRAGDRDVDRAAGAAAHALGHPLDDVVEGDDLLGLVVVGVGGELHQLVDERAELTGLDLEVGEDRPGGWARAGCRSGGGSRRWCGGW